MFPVYILLLGTILLVVTLPVHSSDINKKTVNEQGKVIFDFCATSKIRKSDVKLTILPVPLEIGVSGKLSLEISLSSKSLLRNITSYYLKSRR